MNALQPIAVRRFHDEPLSARGKRPGSSDEMRWEDGTVLEQRHGEGDGEEQDKPECNELDHVRMLIARRTPLPAQG